MGVFDIFCCCSKTEDMVETEAPEGQNNPASQTDDFEKEKELPMETTIMRATTHSIKQMETINTEENEDVPENTIQ